MSFIHSGYVKKKNREMSSEFQTLRASPTVALNFGEKYFAARFIYVSRVRPYSPPPEALNVWAVKNG
jgi:hypothetical protein